MNLPHILSALMFRPWLITPEYHGIITKLVLDHIANVPRLEREGTGVCGEAVELDQMSVEDGVAHIPIGGVIGHKLSSFEKGSGAVDVSDVTRDLDEAEENPEVSTILLDIDSPGGMVTGTPELGDRILQVEKPIYAYTAGQAASAAYWAASATDGIFATKTASLGSVGVYLPWIDRSEQAAAAGIKVDMITSDKFKGMGFPGTSLSKEQRELLQGEVDELAAMFRGHVSSQRGDVTRESMQGQSFMGEAAQKRGFVDHIVSGKAEVLALIG